ncbi:hypothetical protein B296_00038842 [Ensete ventricosum]|uniref:protein-serine/threonine phosphatase n=1 Tax=Ensete ventricosum TaxID=4639 RepID=A0A426ZV51_ENSVE|nr:hypothetical protein B296_00038842 [Ensete ventricosum]
MDKFTGLIEGLIWSPRGGYSNEHADEWAYEEVVYQSSDVITYKFVQVVLLDHILISLDQHLDAQLVWQLLETTNSLLQMLAILVVYCLGRVELCDDDDFLILACDGVWDCMSNQQLVDFINEQIETYHVIVYRFNGKEWFYWPIFIVAFRCRLQDSRLSTICERVLDRCLAPNTISGEGCDNMTMILVQFKKPIKSSDADP